MSLLNIGGSIDPAFRYKMPRLVTKIEGRGNGIKTVIVNCQDVSDALHRPVSHLVKFFGCELGAQSKYDKKNEKCLVTGAHENAEMQELVNLFCTKFVLCPTCNLPETALSIKSKKGEIWHKCAACGSKQLVDMTHKLCAFIIKETKAEKKNKSKNGEEKETTKKEEREAKKAAKKAAKEKEEKRKEKEAKKAAKEAKKAKKADVDEELDEASIQAKTIVEEAKAIESTWNRLADFIESGEQTSAKILEEIINLQLSGQFSGYDKVLLFYMATIGKCEIPSAIDKSIKTYMDVWTALITNQSMQEVLIACVERHIRANFSMLKHAPVILKLLYDSELLEEDVILIWAGDRERSEFSYATVEDAAINMIKAKSKPFVDWLAAAEESDSGEEESESEAEEAED
jgi:translation initiation factor 5